MDKVPHFFLTFEGGEAVGKSTQIALLHHALAEKGYHCLSTREPGGTPLGEKIRDLFLSPPTATTSQKEDLSPLTELFLMMAARGCHIENVIKPALQKGTWVLCDRYIDSSLVYQGILGGVPIDDILDLHTRAHMNFLPHITILLLRHAEEALYERKISGYSNRFDEASQDFHRRVEAAYESLVALWPHRFCVIKEDGSPEDIHKKIMSHLKKRGVLPEMF